MTRYEEFILGDATLHQQLSTALAVMTKLICNASRPPTSQQLAETMGVSLRSMRKLMLVLASGGLLKAHERNADTWTCSRAAHTISLADIYHCLVLDKEEGTGASIATAQPVAGIPAADLLMLQATMEINQVVLQHLQRFDLGHLKLAESAMLFTTSLREKARQHSSDLQGEGDTTLVLQQ